MKSIALASCFRNNSGFHIQRFFVQVARLGDFLCESGHELHLKLVWGDCTDDTRDQLYRAAHALGMAGTVQSFELIERSHHGPVFGSTEEPARMKALSYVGNGAFESVGSGIDALIYVESDLLWHPKTMARLLAMTREPHVDVVAPLVFAGEAFYDIWGFRNLDGERYGPFFPFNRDLKHTDELTEVGSVGSCLVMRGEVARNCRIIDDYCLVGFCKDARNKGYRVWVSAKDRVHHP